MSAQQGVDLIRAKQGATDGSLDPNYHADALQLVVDAINNRVCCEFTTKPDLPMTSTFTTVTGWTSDDTQYNIGISELNGEFTFTASGLIQVHLERRYRNEDTNPSVGVVVEIEVQRKLDAGGIYETIFNRTAAIGAATANDEPEILSFTTPTNIPVTAGNVFRIRVRAVEGVGSPSACFFELCKVVANRIGDLI